MCKSFKLIRIILYIILAILLILLKFTNIFMFNCYINDTFHVLCPTCGITRATIAILNFDFLYAISHNAYYTLVLFPIFFILFIDDIVCLLLNKRSFVDIIFGN